MSAIEAATLAAHRLVDSDWLRGVVAAATATIEAHEFALAERLEGLTEAQIDEVLEQLGDDVLAVLAVLKVRER